MSDCTSARACAVADRSKPLIKVRLNLKHILVKLKAQLEKNNIEMEKV